jgi:hypothetical protein
MQQNAIIYSKDLSYKVTLGEAFFNDSAMPDSIVLQIRRAVTKQESQ